MASTKTKEEIVEAEVHDVAEAKEPKAKKEAKPKKEDGDRKALAQQVFDIREATGKSWKLISDELDLGSPGKARKLWSEHTGKPHTEAREVSRVNAAAGGTKKKGKKGAPEIDLSTVEPIFSNEATDSEVMEVVQPGKTVTWLRTDKKSTDSATVKEIRHITTNKDGLKTLSFVEAGTNAVRNCHITKIIDVR